MQVDSTLVAHQVSLDKGTPESHHLIKVSSLIHGQLAEGFKELCSFIKLHANTQILSSYGSPPPCHSTLKYIFIVLGLGLTWSFLSNYKWNVCVTWWQMSQTVLLLVRIWAVTGNVEFVEMCPVLRTVNIYKMMGSVMCLSKELEVFCPCYYQLNKVFWWKPALSATNRLEACSVSGKQCKWPTHLCCMGCASLHAR